MEESQKEETKPLVEDKKVEDKKFNFKKYTSKEFKAFFKARVFWDSRKNGTLDLGINKHKREKKLGIK
jgi:hypothetical protein